MIAARRFALELLCLSTGLGLPWAAGCSTGGNDGARHAETNAATGEATNSGSTSGATNSVTSGGEATNTNSTSTSTISSTSAVAGSATASSTADPLGTTSTGGAGALSTASSMGGSTATASGGGAAQVTSSDSTSAAGGTMGAGGSAGSDCPGGGGAAAIIAAHTGAWRIMPLGDSITGTTCYPQLLRKKLVDGGHTNFEFVGSVLNNQSCGATNVNTEGHGGYLVTELVGGGPNASEPGGWFSAAQPEVVVMHFGTNDVWNNVSAGEITSAYSDLLAGLRAVNPNVITFVAQIVDMNPSGCAECSSRVQTLNAAIPAWATAESTCDSPVYVVDLFAGFETVTDTGDGVHPNTTGSQKMADKLSAALVEVGVP